MAFLEPARKCFLCDGLSLPNQFTCDICQDDCPRLENVVTEFADVLNKLIVEHHDAVEAAQAENNDLQEEINLLRKAVGIHTVSVPAKTPDARHNEVAKSIENTVSKRKPTQKTRSSVDRHGNNALEGAAAGLAQEIKAAFLAADQAVAKAKQEQTRALKVLNQGMENLESMMKQMQQVFSMAPVSVAVPAQTQAHTLSESVE